MTIRTLSDFVDRVREVYGVVDGDTLRDHYDEHLQNLERQLVIDDIYRRHGGFATQIFGRLLEFRDPDECEFCRRVFWTQLAYMENRS